ncbi:MAG TPA: hydroxylamine reductase [Syntrophomonas sp.]|nr:hydroxylamine reductase [Syntrophomonas sp.]
MYCYQCQETSKNVACVIQGFCGKDEQVAEFQDLLIYILKGIAQIAAARKDEAGSIPALNWEVAHSLLMTAPNANFDAEKIQQQMRKMISLRNELRTAADLDDWHDAATFELDGGKSGLYAKEHMLYKASRVGVLATRDEELRSFRETILYGIKGIAAFLHQASATGKEDDQICAFLYEAMAATLDDTLSLDDLMMLVEKTGRYGLRAMALLDEAYTSRYGNPEITEVQRGVRNNPAILVSGHHLDDLEQLLEQTQGTGVDVYTHGEMLAAHYYPWFKKYDHLVGNYGDSWRKQAGQFRSFRGPILFTSGCMIPPRQEGIGDRVFTTGFAGYPGCFHIASDVRGKKDFSALIRLAQSLPVPDEIESGTITGGFARNQLESWGSRLAEAVKSGAIRKIIVMAGCDGRMKSREYYTEFAGKLPADTVILAAGCVKYRFNKLVLGDISGIPRFMDAGQINDCYAIIAVVLKLKKILGVDDINKLPIVYNIAWYAPHAIIVWLALLSLGVKDIHIGPTWPAFITRSLARILTERYRIAGIHSVNEDIAVLMTDNA